MLEGQEGITCEQWLALGHAAEEAELDGLFRTDYSLSIHRGPPAGALDAWVTLGALGALGARPSACGSGHSYRPVTFRNIAVLATSAVSVDHISAWRAELGIGTGWLEAKHVAYGVPFPGPRERFDGRDETEAEERRRAWLESTTAAWYRRWSGRLNKWPRRCADLRLSTSNAHWSSTSSMRISRWSPSSVSSHRPSRYDLPRLASGRSHISYRESRFRYSTPSVRVSAMCKTPRNQVGSASLCRPAGLAAGTERDEDRNPAASAAETALA